MVANGDGSGPTPGKRRCMGNQKAFQSCNETTLEPLALETLGLSQLFFKGEVVTSDGLDLWEKWRNLANI